MGVRDGHGVVARGEHPLGTEGRVLGGRELAHVVRSGSGNRARGKVHGYEHYCWMRGEVIKI